MSALFRGALLSTAILASAYVPDVAVGAVVGLLLSVAVASLVDWRLSPAAIAAGSFAMVALFGPLPPALGAAGFALMVGGPRMMRASHLGWAICIGVLALGSGAATALLAGMYVPPNTQAQIMAGVAGAVLCAIPYAIPVDDRVASTLRRAALRQRGAHRVRLLRALALRRKPVPEATAGAARAIRAGWRGLLDYIDAEQHDAARVRIAALESAHRSLARVADCRGRFSERDVLTPLEEELQTELAAFEEAQQAMV
ncbi:MAG: hypothetical protein AAGE52_10060 [Myxococcota bacterium]